MEYNRIKIPENQISIFKFLFHLPDLVRDELLQAIKQAPAGLTPSSLYEYFTDNISNMSNEKIGKLLSIFDNLLMVKEDLNYNDEEFIKDLANALQDTEEADLVPNEKTMSVFSELFKSNTNITTSRKVYNSLLDNDKIYYSSNIYTDIRPVFDKNEFIGSAIINNFKINYEDNGTKKDIFFALDFDDLIDLIDELQMAKEKNENMISKFGSLNIIEFS